MNRLEYDTYIQWNNIKPLKGNSDPNYMNLKYIMLSKRGQS